MDIKDVLGSDDVKYCTDIFKTDKGAGFYWGNLICYVSNKIKYFRLLVDIVLSSLTIF